MRIQKRGIALAAVIALLPVPEARAEVSIDRIRRDAHLHDEADLATLMANPAVEAAPIEMREADPFFGKILGQILADVDAGNPNRPASKLAKDLQDTLGLDGQT